MANVAFGISAVIIGAVTKNWTPLIKVVENSNQISTIFRLQGIIIAKLVNKINNN